MYLLFTLLEAKFRNVNASVYWIDSVSVLEDGNKQIILLPNSLGVWRNENPQFVLNAR